MTLAPRTVIHIFSTFNLGGPQSRFVALLPSWSERYQHVVLAMDGAYGAKNALVDSELLQTLPLAFKKGQGLPNFRVLRRLIKDQRPCAIFSYNWGAFETTFANIGTGIPHFHVEEGFGPEERSARLRRRSLTRSLGFSLSKTKLVTVSETIRQIAISEWSVNPNRLIVIPNGVDLREFVPKLERPDHAAQVTIGTAAGLRQEKRIDRLIEAFALAHKENGNLRLKILGAGPELSSLQSLSRQLGVVEQVEFCGYSKQTANFYRTIDIFALSSDTEQMPLSLVEAMASGLPVIATAVGDVAQICGPDQSDFVVPPETGPFAKALLQLSVDSSKRLSLGRANRLRAEKLFGDKAMIEAWKRLLPV
jgi:glycosyltransferase involved in cell wall biosynthesis